MTSFDERQTNLLIPHAYPKLNFKLPNLHRPAKDRMKPWFEELDYRKTQMGELTLQRRRITSLNDTETYEVKLNNDYLMSSLFHEAEVAMTDLALSQLRGTGWTVVVGGLGLGYTAATTLKFPQMKRLIVVEALEPVIDWHSKGLVPNGTALNNDTRCKFLNADFFALAREEGFDPETPGTLVDAVLLDIDHTPDNVLASGHSDFYTGPGLRRFARFLKPTGIFALWSNEPPAPEFLDLLRSVFGHAKGHLIEFDNPLQNKTSTNGIYLASQLPL